MAAKKSGMEMEDDRSLSSPGVSTMSSMSEKVVSSGRKRPMKFIAGGTCFAHDDHGDGEDALFICADGSAIGVSDGVGGWAEEGIDAGEYSRSLMSNAAQCRVTAKTLDPLRMLEVAFRSSAHLVGSATACILSMKGNVMRAVNLGDSGFLVLRPQHEDDTFRLMMKSEMQTHVFNCPRQLGTHSVDTPASADKYRLELQVGDYIIVGTDGFFDNMHLEDIVEAIDSFDDEENLNDELTAAKLSYHLARYAYNISKDPHARTPFAADAQDHGCSYEGGKEDDITVIFAVVGHKDDHSNDDEQQPQDFVLPPSAFNTPSAKPQSQKPECSAETFSPSSTSCDSEDDLSMEKEMEEED